MTMLKPELRYSRTLHVTVPDKELFGKINELIVVVEDGQKNLCVTWEDLISCLDDEENKVSEPEVYKFLFTVRDNAEGEVGDVVFYCSKK